MENQLDYFISLLEACPVDAPGTSTTKWNKRADFWKKERTNNRKDDDRVMSAITYLEEKGILQKSYHVADIGCGPGRFAAEFAKRTDHVVGLDISEKMVSHGMEHLQKLEIENALLRTCDFQTLDIEKESYKGAFDLVFSSMTPAIFDRATLMKSIEMSRAWCFHITHLSGRNPLQEQIALDVFGKKLAPQWTGRWFYAIFNVLFLMGYHPETTYINRHRENWMKPTEEYAEQLMSHILPIEEQSMENVEKIRLWLQTHQNEDGLILDASDTSYGRLLWDVRTRTERPNYNTTDQGV